MENKSNLDHLFSPEAMLARRLRREADPEKWRLDYNSEVDEGERRAELERKEDAENASHVEASTPTLFVTTPSQLASQHSRSEHPDVR